MAQSTVKTSPAYVNDALLKVALLAATGQQLFMNFKLLQNDVFFFGELSAFIGPLIH